MGIIGGKILSNIVANKVIECFVSVEESEVTESVWSYIITVAVAITAVIVAFFVCI